MKSVTGYEIGDRVWDNLLKRIDEIIAIDISLSKSRTLVFFKLNTHAGWVGIDEISKEDGCSCPPKYNDGRTFDGVSYHCKKHGR